MEEWEQKFREENKNQVDFMLKIMVDNERRRREKERENERNRIQPGAVIVDSNTALPISISGGAPIVSSSYPEVPWAYQKYARRLVAAVEYLANNNYGTAKISVDDEINVTPQHLRNTLRMVRNYMLSNPPMGYPIQNLTFADVADGVIVRDKRKSEPFRVTVPVAKPSNAVGDFLPYPIVLTPELIAALAVVLAAVDQSGAPIEWPNFAVEIIEPENVMTYNDLMRTSFPKHWSVGIAGSSTVRIEKVKG